MESNNYIKLHTIDVKVIPRHNGRDGVSNHQHRHCLLNRLFRLRSKKTSKLRVTGLCAGNSLVTGEFLAQMASNAENVCIWWCLNAGENCTYPKLTFMNMLTYTTYGVVIRPTNSGITPTISQMKSRCLPMTQLQHKNDDDSKSLKAQY